MLEKGNFIYKDYIFWIGINNLKLLKIYERTSIHTKDSAARSLPSERAAFIRRTYAHLAVALIAFIGLEYYLVNAPFAANLAMTMTGGFSWLIVLGLFMVVSHFANKLALSGGLAVSVFGAWLVRYCGSDCVPASFVRR